MIGERLKRARAAAGFSMQALASRVGVSANMIKKYEHDASMPSSAVLLKLASSLGVRSEFFFRPTQVALEQVEYRKKASAPAKLIQRIEADVLEQAERWQELEHLWPNYPLAAFAYTPPCQR
jgi:transcriptional regulator with XRE-family HTH domain